jgi:hypothetical protein
MGENLLRCVADGALNVHGGRPNAILLVVMARS